MEIPTTPPIIEKYGLVQSTARRGGEAPNTNDFLQLLVTQLQNQDPLSPMENAEFIQQVAQFSSLEETQNLNAQISNLVTIQEVVAGQNAFTQSANLVGKQVEFAHPDTGEDETGVVSAVHVTADGLILDIDGLEVPLAQVTGLLAPHAPVDPVDPATDDDASADDTDSNETNNDSSLDNSDTDDELNN